MLAPKPRTAKPKSDLQTKGKLELTTDLTRIYPDIEDELCSRHSILMGKLKHTFNKLYDGMEPSHYIVVKGNTRIIGEVGDEF